MVLGIRHVFVFRMARFVLPGPFAYSRGLSGNAINMDVLTVPIYRVFLRKGSLSTHVADKRLHVTHSGILHIIVSNMACLLSGLGQ